jgi:hypothetical protein
MLARQIIYLMDTFKLPRKALFVFVQITIMGLYTDEIFVIGKLTCAFLASLSILLFVRANDELKDQKSDKIFFPQRALVSGQVKPLDLKVLKIICLLCILATSLIYTQASKIGGVIFCFCVLLHFSFFIPKKLESSPLLSFSFNIPLALLFNLFPIAIFTHAKDVEILSGSHVALVLIMTLTVLHQEILRKTKFRERPGYQTYSSVLSYQGAILLSMGLLAGLLFALRFLLTNFFYLPLATFSIIYFIYLWNMGLKEHESPINLYFVANIYGVILYLTVLGFLLINQ